MLALANCFITVASVLDSLVRVTQVRGSVSSLNNPDTVRGQKSTWDGNFFVAAVFSFGSSEIRGAVSVETFCVRDIIGGPDQRLAL